MKAIKKIFSAVWKILLIKLPFSNHGTDQQVNRTALLNWLKNYDGMLPDSE